MFSGAERVRKWRQKATGTKGVRSGNRLNATSRVCSHALLLGLLDDRFHLSADDQAYPGERYQHS